MGCGASHEWPTDESMTVPNPGDALRHGVTGAGAGAGAGAAGDGGGFKRDRSSVSTLKSSQSVISISDDDDGMGQTAIDFAAAIAETSPRKPNIGTPAPTVLSLFHTHTHTLSLSSCLHRKFLLPTKMWNTYIYRLNPFFFKYRSPLMPMHV